MNLKLITALAAGLLSATPVLATTITLDFEGATSFASLNNFYNGGTDGAGASGINYGVSFGGDALALSNDILGPYYSNAPTNGTVLAPVGADSALNFTTGFYNASFYYSASDNTSVSVYSGLNGTGSLLGTFNLFLNAQTGCSDSPYCHWDLATVTLSGIGHSIQFGSAAGVAGFDNVAIAPVPLPATLWLLVSGLGSLGVFTRRRKRHDG